MTSLCTEEGKTTKPPIFWDKPHKLAVVIFMGNQNCTKELTNKPVLGKSSPDFTVCLWTSSKLLSKLGLFAAGYFTAPGQSMTPKSTLL